MKAETESSIFFACVALLVVLLLSGVRPRIPEIGGGGVGTSSADARE